MAFDTYETRCDVLTAGPVALRILFGRAVNTAGSTGGVITPGSPTQGLPADRSGGMRSLLAFYSSSSTMAPSEPQVVKSSNIVTDREEYTVTTAADQVLDFVIIGKDTGEDL